MVLGWKRRAWIGLVVTLSLLVAVFGRQVAGWWARQRAAGDLEAGAIGKAESWLAWAAGLGAVNDRAELLRAACLRHLGQRQPWEEAVDAAEQHGSPRDLVQREIMLGRIQRGEPDRILASDVQRLTEAGASQWEAVTAVAQGLLARQDPATARQVIDAWKADVTDEAQVSYLRGMCFWIEEQREAAQQEFQRALDRHPGHELARGSLARTLEQQERLAEALSHYAHLSTAVPHRQAAQVDLARVLRKLGRSEEARRIFPAPPAQDSVPVAVAIEMAEREYDAGDYHMSRHWFERAELDGAHVADTLRTAASAMAFSGDHASAAQLFERVDEAQRMSRFVGELRRRLAIDPSDKVAASEMQRLMQPPAKADTPSAADRSLHENVDPLYLQRCAACHGEDGDGQGRAARFLFPRPRNLQADQYRIVSTQNGVPTLDDIQQVIRRGIPGTAMPPFRDGNELEVSRLAQLVQRLRQEGTRRRLAAEFQRAAQRVEEDEIAEVIAVQMTPSQVVHVPPIGPVTDMSIQRGRQVYLALGCHQCHAEDGRGAEGISLWDAEGRRVTPRDLTRDPMKGGDDVESIFRRIRLGMPGTPHPAAITNDDEDPISLVHFCLSRSQKPARELTNYERALRASSSH